MIGPVLRVQWLNLRRDRVAQALTFLLPIIFFSIFAVIFGGAGGGNATRRVRVLVVDEDGTRESAALAAALERDESLIVERPDPQKFPPTRAAAEQQVHDGSYPVAIVIPHGFSEGFGTFTGEGAPVKLLADQSDPIAPNMVAGLLQRAAMTAAPDIFARRGIEMFEQYVGMTDDQRESVSAWLARIDEWAASRPDAASRPAGESAAASSASAAAPDSAPAAAFSGPVQVEVVDVLGKERNRSPLIAFYAAGTGVMFLLFAAAGAGGTLLEEEECGALQRVLSSHVSMTQLLLGKWIFLALVGALQVTLMFVWGTLVFGVELLKPGAAWLSLERYAGGHLPAFLVMTAFTAAAAAAFGLMLAAACRSRAQLSGISTILILVMSALGGSMFPRFLMSDTLKEIGRWTTFNAWALDGYQAIFWRDAPITALGAPLLAMAVLTIVLLGAARVLARRWETA